MDFSLWENELLELQKRLAKSLNLQSEQLTSAISSEKEAAQAIKDIWLKLNELHKTKRKLIQEEEEEPCKRMREPENNFPEEMSLPFDTG